VTADRPRGKGRRAGGPGGPGGGARPGAEVARRERQPLPWPWAYAIVAALVLVFFFPITMGNVFISPDSVAPAGFAKIANEAIQKRHVYPLWNPYHFLGMPSYGSLAFTPYVYPPDPIFGFLNGTLGFPDLTWLLAHYLLLGIAMLALLRGMGLGSEAALFGAFTLALTPNLVAVGAFGHGSQIMTAAYLPLLVLTYDRFVRRGSWLALAGFAFAAAFQLLRGHVQIVFYSWLAIGGYALFLAVSAFREGRREEGVRAIGGLVGGLLLGFGMSAFLYLPIHDYSQHSTRGGGEGGGAGLEYATSWSFHPREILTFLIPSMFGFGGATYWGSMPFTDYPNYMGIVPLALAVYGAMRTRGVIRWYLVALAGAALLISFGKHFQPLYSLLYYHLPFFNKFRVPVMILVLVQFATAALAAFGLAAALRTERSGGRGDSSAGVWFRGAGAALGGGVLAMVAFQAMGPSLKQYAVSTRQGFDAARAARALDMATLDAMKSAIFLAGALALIGLARRGRLSRQAAALLILGVTAADLWVIDRQIIDPMVATKERYHDAFRESPEVTYLASDSTQFRVLPLRWDDSRLAAFGVASVLGYHPAKPRLYQAFMDTVGFQSLPTLQMLNVKYVLADGYFPPEQAGVVLRHDGDVKVYEIEGALPRAFVVHSIHPVRSDGVVLAIIRTLGFTPHREALWSEPETPPLVELAGLPDSVHTIRYDFNEIEYMVSTAAPGLLVTVDQWDPDWSVTVDGNPGRIHRVNYLMRGVAIPAGVHRVRFRYQPRSLEAGIRISSLAAVLTLLIAGFGLYRRAGARRGPVAPPGNVAPPGSATPPSGKAS
jgi:hypothetical protein